MNGPSRPGPTHQPSLTSFMSTGSTGYNNAYTSLLHDPPPARDNQTKNHKWFRMVTAGNFGVLVGMICGTLLLVYNDHTLLVQILATLAFMFVGMIAGYVLLAWAFGWDARTHSTIDRLEGVNILQGVLCVVIPLIYIFWGGFVKYTNQPQWDFDTEYEADLLAPAIAIIGGYNDAAMAEFVSGGTVKCNFPRYDKPCSASAFSNRTVPLNLADYGANLQAYIFNGLQDDSLAFSNTSDRLLLQISVNYDLSALQHQYGDEQAPQTPYLFVTMYDSSMSLQVLQDSINCGLIGLTEIPALASTTFGITTTYIKDTRRLMTLTDNSKNCQKTYDTILKPHDYATYTFHSASMPINNVSACDSSADASASCIMQVIMRFDKHIVEKLKSGPGVEWYEIWLNYAALVGAIQFVAWFFTVFWTT